MKLSFGYDPATGTGTILSEDETTGLLSVEASSRGRVRGAAIDQGTVIEHED